MLNKPPSVVNFARRERPRLHLDFTLQPPRTIILFMRHHLRVCAITLTKVESEELGFRSQSSRSLPPTLSHMPVIVDAGELEVRTPAC